MNLQRIQQRVSFIATQASFILSIKNEVEHTQALDLLEQLIEDYDQQEPLIELLCVNIEKYEDTAE